MSLFAHRQIVKAIEEGRVDMPDYDAKMVLHFYHQLKSAEKFDFGPLVLEQDRTPLKWGDGRPGYSLPKLTKVECEFWAENLIPVPAPLCWYEFSLGHHPSGILLTDDGVHLSVTRFDYERGAALIPGIVWQSNHVEWATAESSEDLKAGSVFYASGNLTFFRKMYAENPAWVEADASNVGMAVYLTLMLNSKTTEREVRHAGNPPSLPKLAASNPGPLTQSFESSRPDISAMLRPRSKARTPRLVSTGGVRIFAPMTRPRPTRGPTRTANGP